MKAYKRRIADKILDRKLRTMGAVLINGPKWCGKTTTAEQKAGSVIYMDTPGQKEQYKRLAKISPGILLGGETPRLIDEWQEAPELWDAIRFEVDHRENSIGQFILTGSSTPPDKDKISHSGTGRFARMTMRPMSLYESGESDGSVSLKDNLFAANRDIVATCAISLQDMAMLMCRGGWPQAAMMNDENALDIAYEYISAVADMDISRVGDVRRSPDFTRRLLRSYARHQGAPASISTIRADILANEKDTLGEDSIASYISALKQLYVIEDVSAWNPNIRSKTAIRTSDTRYFVDPSIAAASLGLGPQDLINDLKTMGLLFETLVMRDLRVYAEAENGHVYHYRDKSGLECDAIVHLRNGSYGMIEIKLGGADDIESGASTLKALKNQIDTERMPAPAFLAVIIATGQYAYCREDGVSVVPIGCLKD